MAIGSWDQVMYAWNNNTLEVVELENTFGSTYYNGNFKGAHRIPVTVSSARLAKPSGTTTYDLSSHIKNDGTYIRFDIKASGATTYVIAGDVYLIFEDPSDPLLELTYTIQAAVDAGFIDPIVFRYTSMSSTSYTWNTANLFDGGRTDSKNYPYAYLFVRPYAEYTLKKIRFYSNKAFNTTYDGFIISQTNISKIATTEAGVTPAFKDSGTYTTEPIALDGLPDLRLNWIADEPYYTSVTGFYYIGYDVYDQPDPYDEWTPIENGGLIEITEEMYDCYLYVKLLLETEDIFETPLVTSLWLEEAVADPKKIQINLIYDGRMKHPQGLVTVKFIGSMNGRNNSIVAPFELAFTPQNLILWFNPNSTSRIKLNEVTLATNLVTVYYNSYTTDDAHVSLDTVSLTTVLTHIDDIET